MHARGGCVVQLYARPRRHLYTRRSSLWKPLNRSDSSPSGKEYSRASRLASRPGKLVASTWRPQAGRGAAGDDAGLLPHPGVATPLSR